MGIIGLLIHILVTQKLSFDAGTVIKTVKGYSNLPSIAYAVAVFLIIKQISDKISIKNVFVFLSKYTFEFYLMQYFIYTTIERLFDLDTKLITYRLGTPLIVVLFTIIITWILRKIPILKKIVP